jgi:hypothetical protein
MAPVVSAVCYTLAEPWQMSRPRIQEGVAFVFRQIGRLPAYLRIAILLLTGLINGMVFVLTGRPLQAHGPESRRRILAVLERYALGPLGDWFRFFRILMALHCHRDGAPSA